MIRIVNTNWVRYFRRASILMLFALLIGYTAESFCADVVRRKSGAALTGEIKEVAPQGVVIEVKSKKQTIDAFDIETINFAGQSALLTRAKKNFIDGKYEDVVEAAADLAKDPPKKQSIAADLEYLPAAAAGMLALSGRSEPGPAKTKLGEFVASHGKSYQYLPAVNMLAELAMLDGDFDAAGKQYEILAKGKSVEGQRKGLMGVARVYLQQGKSNEARSAAERLTALGGNAESSRGVELQLILAACDAAEGKTEQAVTSLLSVVKALPTDQMLLRAQTYNTLGYCYEKENRLEEAALAYLHTDLVYFQDAREHAKALKQLIAIWEKLNRPDRVAEARRILQERYPQLN